ncbi:hypothetical protein [Jidongwangia harbinensis]|uniref:hypothetical protein n=1 Tax=Jidongwangia harbinensis TaxID=2878561 RepID=UPI001CD953FF|nr:hypothetical protein [Jidongwangia harbinensis]MCA2213041.1 hypothetical protein [Jidongwangia harbinensis]
MLLDHSYWSLYLWASLTLTISVAPLVHVLAQSAAEASRQVLAQRRIGHRLIRAGLISRKQLDELLDLQATSEEAWQRLGDLAVQHGYVSTHQLTEVRR